MEECLVSTYFSSSNSEFMSFIVGHCSHIILGFVPGSMSRVSMMIKRGQIPSDLECHKLFIYFGGEQEYLRLSYAS